MRTYTPAPEVAVTTDPTGAPSSVTWRGQTHRGRVTATWCIETAWWECRPVARQYYLLSAADLQCEVYRDLATDRWHLQAIHD